MKISMLDTRLTDTGGIKLVRKGEYIHKDIETFNHPYEIYFMAKDVLLMDLYSEEFVYMLCFNTKMKLQGIFEVSHGTVDSSIISPREIFQKALLANAASIILIHNHPSGDPKPSAQDVEITKRIKEAGELMNLPLKDHIIIGKGDYISIFEKETIK